MRTDDEMLTASQKYGVIPQAMFMRLEDQKVMQVYLNAEILKHVEPNDFVISMRSFQGGLEFCGYTGCVSSAYVGIFALKHVEPGFFKFLFKSSPYIQALQSTSNLVRDGQALRFQNFSMVRLPVVPKEEQKQIAAFLDYETAKIDALIEKQQQLIALLGEKRQAVISHAVTKGLNPDAPMRDSGVEWLGQVPEHWTVCRLKHAFSFLTSGSRGWSDLISDDGTSVFLQSGDLNDELGLRLDTANELLRQRMLRA
jgi:type I restriction enzyme S subunit